MSAARTGSCSVAQASATRMLSCSACSRSSHSARSAVTSIGAGPRGQPGQALGRAPPHAGAVAAGSSSSRGELPDHLEGREALRAVGTAPDQPLVDEGGDRLERVVVGARREDLLEGVQGRAAREDGEHGERCGAPARPAGRSSTAACCAGSAAAAGGPGARCAGARAGSPGGRRSPRAAACPTLDAASSTASGSRPTPSTIRVDGTPGRPVPGRSPGGPRGPARRTPRPPTPWLSGSTGYRCSSRSRNGPREVASTRGPAAARSSRPMHLGAVPELLHVVEHEQQPAARAGARPVGPCPRDRRTGRGQRQGTGDLVGHQLRVADLGEGDEGHAVRVAPAQLCARCSARRVLPTPPGPVRVTSRCPASSPVIRATSSSRPKRGAGAAGRS